MPSPTPPRTSAHLCKIERDGLPLGPVRVNGIKPKGMHWHTFERLEAQHDALVNQTLAGVMAMFGPLRELIER